MDPENKKEIQEHFAKAQKLVQEARKNDDFSKLPEAEVILHNILNINPSNLSVIFFLACIHMLLKNEGLAQILFSAVYRANKDFINAGNNLGILFKQKEKKKQAAAIYLELIKTMEEKGHELFPDPVDYNDTIADLYSNIGSCYTNNGTPEIALEYYHKSLALKDKLDRDTPRFNLSLSCLETGNYEEGWKNYKYYTLVHPERRKKNYHTEENPTPKWEGNKEQIVVVLGEQGLGDELMFATILPDMMEEVKIIFDCHPRLQNLFKRAWPLMPIFGTRKDLNSIWHNMVQPDVYIPISETAQFYRNKKEDFKGLPYLKADPKLKPLLPELIKNKNSKPKIGFSWTGGLQKTNMYHRTIPYPMLLQILSLDCEFFSLQYNAYHNKQLLDLCKEHNLENVHVYQEILDNYDLTACMLEELDFIVCAPQSVIYLAGALDVKTYQLCPRRGMWQQGVYGQDAPWFRSVKNIWQKDFDKWDNVIDETIGIIQNAINK